MSRQGRFAQPVVSPAGFLPHDRAALLELLRRFGLRLVAGFVPAVLHERWLRDEQLALVDSAAGSSNPPDLSLVTAPPPNTPATTTAARVAASTAHRRRSRNRPSRSSITTSYR